MKFEYKNKSLKLKDLTLFVMCDQRIIKEFCNFKGHSICVLDDPHTGLSYLDDPRETDAFLKILGYEYVNDENVKSLMHQYHHLFEIVLCCFGNGLEYNYGERYNNRMVAIQNPEYGLTPKQQKRLCEFLFPYLKAFNIILVTNSQDILHSVCYGVFTNSIDVNNVIIYNQSDSKDELELIKIAKNGGYLNADNKPINYPSGFFDASYNEIIQMG